MRYTKTSGGPDGRRPGIGLNYYFCDHNTVVNCAKFCWLESYYRNAYIANNLLVNSHFTGERMKDRKYQDPGTLLYGQTINLDTLKTPGRRITPEEAIRVYGSDAVQFSDQMTLSPTDPQDLFRHDLLLRVLQEVQCLRLDGR